MVRWRLSLALAILLVLPAFIGAKSEEEDDEDRRSEDTDEDEDEDEDEEEEEGAGAAGGNNVPGRSRAPDLERDFAQDSMSARGSASVPGAYKMSTTTTKSSKKRPLECYVCAFKSETPLRACLDPTKFRVHTITCHTVDDMCFTTVVSKGDSYEAVVRGCRSNCVVTSETSCCDINRCNNHPFAMPLIQPRAVLTDGTQSLKCFPPTVVFFVTILLILQTVSKVAFA